MRAYGLSGILKMADRVGYSDSLVKQIAAIEIAAEDVLADRQHIVELDRKRNGTREALSALRKDKSDQRTWVCFGNMFLKLEKGKTKNLLQTDYDRLDTEVNETRTRLQTKVRNLRDLEHKPDLKGFHLTALSRQESAAIAAIL